jgi:lactonase family protein with 7-bladed beta-propeller
VARLLPRFAERDQFKSVRKRKELSGVTMSSEESMGMAGEHAMGAPAMSPGEMAPAGHLYMQTNEQRNCVVHYLRMADGTLRERERVTTGGAGSGGYNPIINRESTPNPFEGARSVILSPDRRFLFATNAGDNSVSSFSVDADGCLTLIDAKRTGNVVPGRSGSVKSLQYDPSTGTLYACHSLGPDHIRLLSVDGEGRLSARPERYTVNLEDKPNRVATTITLSPDGKFLIAGTTFDEPAKPNPDGSPILWVSHNGGAPHSVASNAPDPDGLVVFPVEGDGALGEPLFQDGGGGSPWFPLFLNHRSNQFVIGYAVADGLSLASIDSHGNVATGPVVQLDTSAGLPSELCWLSISPDDRTVYATNFGYSYITTYHLEGNVLSVAKDPACPKVPGNGAFRALNGTVSSGPSDNWLSADGRHLYQIYGNAAKLIGYATHPDGWLEEVTSVDIPYNSCQGLDGF